MPERCNPTPILCRYAGPRSDQEAAVGVDQDLNPSLLERPEQLQGIDRHGPPAWKHNLVRS
jgi:hypothetical protein